MELLGCEAILQWVLMLERLRSTEVEGESIGMRGDGREGSEGPE